MKLNDIKSAILYVIFYLIFCVMVAASHGGGNADGATAAGAPGCLLWLIERHPFNYADSATGAHCSNISREGL